MSESSSYGPADGKEVEIPKGDVQPPAGWTPVPVAGVQPPKEGDGATFQSEEGK